MSDLSDLWARAETVPIDSSSGTITVCAAETGSRPVILHVWLLAGVATTVLFDSNGSATVNLTGALPVGTSTPLELKNNGAPVLSARRLGDSIRITNSGPQALDGFAVVARVQNEENAA